MDGDHGSPESQRGSNSGDNKDTQCDPTRIPSPQLDGVKPSPKSDETQSINQKPGVVILEAPGFLALSNVNDTNLKNLISMSSTMQVEKPSIFLVAAPNKTIHSEPTLVPINPKGQNESLASSDAYSPMTEISLSQTSASALARNDSNGQQLVGLTTFGAVSLDKHQHDSEDGTSTPGHCSTSPETPLMTLADRFDYYNLYNVKVSKGPGKIEGFRTRLDTCSMVNLMTEEIARRLEFRDKLEPSDLKTVRCISGAEVPVLGRKRVTFTLDEDPNSYEYWFYVIPGAEASEAPDSILGCEFAFKILGLGSRDGMVPALRKRYRPLSD